MSHPQIWVWCLPFAVKGFISLSLAYFQGSPAFPFPTLFLGMPSLHQWHLPLYQLYHCHYYFTSLSAEIIHGEGAVQSWNTPKLHSDELSRSQQLSLICPLRWWAAMDWHSVRLGLDLSHTLKYSWAFTFLLLFSPSLFSFLSLPISLFSHPLNIVMVSFLQCTAVSNTTTKEHPHNKFDFKSEGNFLAY